MYNLYRDYFESQILKIMPEASFDMDSDGQVIIHTNLKMVFDADGRAVMVNLNDHFSAEGKCYGKGEEEC